MTTTLMELRIAGVTGVPAAGLAPLGVGVALLLVLRLAERSVRPGGPSADSQEPVADDVRRAA